MSVNVITCKENVLVFFFFTVVSRYLTKSNLREENLSLQFKEMQAIMVQKGELVFVTWHQCLGSRERK